MTSTSDTITAFLADGRYVEVPRHIARDWAQEASDLVTTRGLADWYVDRDEDDVDDGYDHDDDDPAEIEILGKRDDAWPLCSETHQNNRQTEHSEYQQVRVVNTSQAAEYVPDHPHASVWVCGRRACVLDAMAWVERETGENAVWLDADHAVHTDPPAADLAR